MRARSSRTTSSRCTPESSSGERMTIMRAGSLKSMPNAAARAATGSGSRTSAGSSASSSSAALTACSWSRSTSVSRVIAASSGAVASAAGLASLAMNPRRGLASTSRRAVWPTGVATACQPATSSSSRPGGSAHTSSSSSSAGGRPATISGRPSALSSSTLASRKRDRRSTIARSGCGVRSASTR